ncbi:E3 ubiquitin-protein ligase ATL6-like [Prosopis cineraria]|uniref:E3 ubiquitin-protein ligase ATL6-like n=1 Tax=Prosopis cineraria TaxID=364024 RepID=UPI00240F5131|nr:E3 ubiquitin-protein ligase ATL6-like [Prosopis cineraria]
MRLLLLVLLLPPPFPLACAQVDNTGPTGPYYNSYTPSMAIIIVILVAALFLTGIFSLYIRHCGQSSGSALPNLAARSRRQPRGLDPSVIRSFPTLDYSAVKVHKIGKGTLECAVCLNEFEDSETLRLMPKCDHVFHPDCIDEWLASHTTCPVCRADLVPQPGDSLHGPPVLDSRADVESQNDAREPPDVDREAAEPDVRCFNQRLNPDSARGSRSSQPVWWARSHSTGHSLLQPGENTDRYTLRLPADVRNRLLNQKFHRATSLVILPGESSSRRGYRTGGEGSSRGRFSRRLDRGFKSDRWVFTMAPPFLVRASSIRSPKVASNSAAVEETSADPIMPPLAVDSARPPV